MKRVFVLCALIAANGSPVVAWADADQRPTVREDEPQLVDVAKLDARLRFDLRYATADNIAGRPLYPVARCFLRPQVAAMLRRAADALEARHPSWHLLLKDCYRPLRAQRLLYDAVRHTPRRGYVADPQARGGSVHSYGAAIDVTLVDGDGVELDMGTPFDFLGHLAEPRREAAFLATGQLTTAQLHNRQTLREAMVTGGKFMSISNEWWHFDAQRGARLRRVFMPLDLPLDGPELAP